MRKRGLAIAMSAVLASVSIAGCSSGSSEAPGESSTEGKNQETSTEAVESSSAPEETEPKETKPEETDETEPDETEPDETEPDETEPEESKPEKPGDKTENAFKMLHMSLEEAREYYEVEEDPDKTQEDFDEFADRIFEESITIDRLTLDQYLQDPEKYGIDYLDEITYDPGSLFYEDGEIEDAIEMNTEEIKELLAFPYEELTDRQKLVFEKMYYQYEMGFWSFDVEDFSSSIGLTSGLISNIAITFYEYIFDTETNVETYQKVMEYLPAVIREVPEHVQYQIDTLGYEPTDEMLETALDSIDGLLETENNPFLDGFDAKIDALSLDEEKADAYKEENRTFYEEEVIPALEEAYDALDAMIGTNPTGQGLYHYDGGLEYYEYLVESSVGSDKSIDELMELLDERIQEDYKALIRSVMLGGDDLDAYINGDIEYPVDEDAQEIVQYFIEQMSGDFPELGDVSYQVSYLPPSLEIDGIVAYYLIPRLDSIAANTIRVNGSATEGDMTSLFMTLAHEGYPGHMLQFNVQQSCGAYDVEQLLSYLGYSEGWAMYAEHRCLEYADLSKSMINLILLDSDLSYNIISYVDLAVNGKGWGVDEVAEYLEPYGYDAEYAFSVVVGDPGALLPYSLGYILTDQAIETYVQETGESYLEAYETFMSIGSAPFTLVEKYMGTEF